MYGIKSFEAFAVGDHASFSKTITEGDVLLFSAVSGDNYPLHVDESCRYRDKADPLLPR